MQAINASTGYVEGRSPSAGDAHSIIALGDDAGETADGANGASDGRQFKGFGQREAEMLILDLLLEVGDGRLDYVRGRRVPALLVPAATNEAGGDFGLSAAQTEKTA